MIMHSRSLIQSVRYYSRLQQEFLSHIVSNIICARRSLLETVNTISPFCSALGKDVHARGDLESHLPLKGGWNEFAYLGCCFKC